jgi:hypothetical protein
MRVRGTGFAWTLAASLFALAAFATKVEAQTQQDAPGQVRLPLDLYNQLIEQSRNPAPRPRPAPVNFALGSASVNVQVSTTEPRASAEVTVTLSIEVFENEWVLIPVLAPGTPLTRVSLQGNPVLLVPTPEGLAWGTNVKGSYSMELRYNVDASSSGGGHVLALPLPRASSIQLSATLPGTGLDVSVLPAAGVRTSPSGSTTNVQATIPSTSGVQIAWRAPSQQGPSIGRALYHGQLSERSVLWRAELRVELFADETATLALLPRTVTLVSLSVDGKEAPILVEGDRFATLVRGQGVHRVAISFQTPVVVDNGPPRTELLVPPVPVSRIDLVLPGKKEVSASPSASVETRMSGGSTEATVHVPLTEKVSLSWSEAIPEKARHELRANASMYHVIRAEEGVLYARAHVVYGVQHGGTNRIELQLPDTVEVNQVTSEGGAVADWRVERQGTRRVLRVFLDRELTSELTLTVDYDRSLGSSDTEALPLLSALGVGRQRGMVALVSSRGRALAPAQEGGATRVGENQLPSFVRDGIDRTIAHTFKYVDAPPSMSVTASAPERAAGRFDAEVDTLLSIGEVTLASSASIDLHVKSGGVDRVDLLLPAGSNLLNLAAPSLRTHRVVDGDRPVVEVEFTQEMEGDFRIDVSYERLLQENEPRVPATSVRVRGADVEQGRIAIEAASAVEVAPLDVEALSPMDVRELPRQLVLRTSQPILHAFRYVRAEPEPRLSLGVTRHALAAVQEAIIDRAEHRTLFTRDGLAVTTTRFQVRNTRKQFLRVRLPQDSEIWSVFVAGKAEKPALDERDEEKRAYLIKIVSSTDGFPVELVYATRVSSMSSLGSVRVTLSRPDLLVTTSHWELYLPDEFAYGRPSTNMSLLVDGGRITREAMAREMGAVADSALASPNLAEPFRIEVPSSGVHYAFEMLYANHGDLDAIVSIPYTSRGGAAFGQIVSLLGVFLAYVALRLGRAREGYSMGTKLGCAFAAALLLLVPIAIYGVSATPALVLASALALLSARPELRRFFERLRSWKRTNAGQELEQEQNG